MTPSKTPTHRHSDTGTDRPVLVADGGSEQPDGEDWKWNPAVDEEPVIESSDEDEPEPSAETDQPAGESQPDPRHESDRRTPADYEPRPQAEESRERRMSRRAMLIGGAGLVATAAVAGRWVVGSGGPTGAKAVADEYITAIAVDDWERAGSLYHEEAGPMRAIERENSTDSYEEYLATNGRLELYEALDPTVESITVLEHFPDLTAENTDRSFLAPTDHTGKDAWKQLVVTLTVDTETLALGRRRESYTDALAGSKTKELMLMGTVSADGEWFLWETSSRL